MKVPDLEVGKRLFVGNGDPNVLGIGPYEIRGSAYIEGPQVVGDPTVWPSPTVGVGSTPLPLPPIPAATLMVGPTVNVESPEPIILGLIPCCVPVNNSPYSLAVQGNAAIFDHLDVAVNISNGGNIDAGGNIVAVGEVKSGCGDHVLSSKKNFDIPHPTKKGWRLTHTCVEGPEAAVYIRGRVTNRTEIELPLYWKELVDIQSITVNLTSIGAHQDVIVKRWDEKKIYLQAKGGMPIDCFYYIMAERKDTEKLIPEYQGTIEDYPGDNSQRSIAGYHYDVKGS
jgi:hypothetical protein